MAKNATIGALKVALGLDSAQFETGLKSAQGKLASFGKLAAVGLAAAATAATAAAVGIAAAVKRSVDAADEMLIASQKLGVGVEALSALKYAADLSAVSFDGLQTGLKKLSVNMAAAAGDVDGKAATAFRTLGVSVTDATGQLRGSDQVFADVAEKFAGMQDGAGKTALAVQLFGKAGADLIPLLNEGKGGLAEMTAEAEALGLIISTKTAQAAESFNDNLDRLKMVGAGVSNQLAAALAPALNDVTAGLVEAVKGGNLMHGVGQALGFTLKVLGTAFVSVAALASRFGNILATVSKAIVQVFKGDFAGALETAKAGVTKDFEIMAQQGRSIAKIWTGAGAANKKVAEPASDGIAAPIVRAADKAGAARKDIESEAEKAAKALRDFVAGEEKTFSERGLSSEQVKIRELQAKANEAIVRGLDAEADRLIRLIDLYRQLGVEIKEVADKQIDFVTTPADLQPEFMGAWDSFSEAVQAAADKYYQIRQASDDVFYSIANRDWVGAFASLVRAIDLVKKAFDSAATSGDKMAAISAVGNAVGSAIGGKVGGTISGAASGAAAGFALGGPIGAGIGAVLGGISGLFGASKAKKRAKREARERARLEAERAAAEEAATKRELEIRLMELAGDAAGARAAREADYLAALSPANQEIAKQILALEKEADARAAATALMAQQRSLEAELAEAMGDSAAALKIFREDELAALPEALRPIKQAIFDALDASAAAAEAQAVADEKVAAAREALSEAAEAEADRLGDLMDKFADLADGIADLRRELDKGGLGSMGPKAQLAAARAAFDAVAGKTDEASLAALPQAARDLIDAETAVATSRSGLNAVFAKVRQALATGEAAARAQMTDAQKQLAALQTQTGALLGIQTGVQSVADAIAGLSNALFEQSSVFARGLQALDEAASKVAAFDVAAAERAVSAMPTVPSLTAANSQPSVGDRIEEQGLLLQQVVVNTGATSRYLDDVTQGGDALRTQAVP